MKVLRPFGVLASIAFLLLAVKHSILYRARYYTSWQYRVVVNSVDQQLPGQISSNTGECDYCDNNRTCTSSLNCLNKKCVSKIGRKLSIARCFPNLHECSICTHSEQCRSSLCWRGRCIVKSPVTAHELSKKKCFSHLASTCRSCDANSDCEQGICYKRKCLLSLKEKTICFPNFGECSSCSASLQCSSGLCWHGRCVVSSPLAKSKISKEKCFKHLKSLCATCSANSQCASRMCYNGKCVLRSNEKKKKISIRQCFPNLGNCAICTESSQCASNICLRGRCVNSSTKGSKSCFDSLKSECNSCSTNLECKSGRCHENKCINGSSRSKFMASVSKCFPNLDECSMCTTSKQCRSSICWRNRCLISSPKAAFETSKKKCFSRHKDTCEVCSSDFMCAFGKCYRGRCISDSEKTRFSSVIKTCVANFRECAICTKSSQCGGGRSCISSRCLETKSKAAFEISKEKCQKHLKKICGTCSANSECGSGRCYHRKCIPHSVTGPALKMVLKKCFPHLNECSLCTSSGQCRSAICWRGRCVQNKESQNKCLEHLKQSCEICSSGSQCRSGKCFHRRCVNHVVSSNSSTEFNKCFPNMSQCSLCTSSSQCRTQWCWRGRCIVRLPIKARQLSERKCREQLANECEPCNAHSNCKSFLCYRGKCLQRGSIKVFRASQGKCFPNFGKCKFCTRSSQCRSGLCFKRRCVPQQSKEKLRDVWKECGGKNLVGIAEYKTKDTCVKCKTSEECKSAKCVKGFCASTFDIENSFARCHGIAPLCTKCEAPKNCKSGSCKLGLCLPKNLSPYLFGEAAAACHSKRVNCSPCVDKCGAGRVCMAGVCLRKSKITTDVSQCFMGSHRCGPCLKESQCAGELACHKQYCVPKGEFKEKSFRRCTGKAKECELCVRDSECSSQSCVFGRCAPCSLRGAVRECGECEEGQDCLPGLVCEEGVCLNDANLDKSEDRCFPSKGECGTCTRNFDCNSEQLACVYGRCVVAFGKGVEQSISRCFSTKEYGQPLQGTSVWGGAKTCSVRRALIPKNLRNRI